MYDPLMRVLTVLEILQARGQATGGELARRLEVSPRTVQRYIARLQDLCIPIEGTPGVGGSYRLKPGFRLPPLMLTDGEATAVTLGLMALRHLGLTAFAPASEGAAAKLARVLPDSVRESVQAIEQVVSLEAGPWTISTSADCVIHLAGAICAQRSVLFDYESHSGARSRREVEPYGLAHMDGRWYLAGHCRTRKALRTFRLDRMSSLEQGNVSFVRPADFDVQEHLHKTMPFVQSKYSIDVWLDLPLVEAQRRLMPSRVNVVEENGGVVIRCGRDELRPFAAMLLGMGCRVVVRSPQELRDEFVQLAARASAAASQARATA
jgi:predicted DNA-binding transcriptional regulator YafY